MRHGADVIPVMTDEAVKLVSPMIFEWSTGNPPIVQITGRVEHVELVTTKRADLVLIAPCTANMIGKIASGISDDPVSTLVCTSLGAGIPLLIAPAMHEPMVRNPVIGEAIEKLKLLGVRFVEGKVSEAKSKIAEPEEVLSSIVELIGTRSKTESGRISSLIEKQEQDLQNLRFLITAGATREPIDQVRFITNSSSGKMGIALAQRAIQRGADEVFLVHGQSVFLQPELLQNSKLKTESVGSTEEMLGSVMNKLASEDFDVFISAGAPADYTATRVLKGKVSTKESPILKLELRATKKIIGSVKEKFPNVLLVAFKTEHGASGEELVHRARETLASSKADLIVANDVARKDIGFDSDFNEVIIVSQKGEIKQLPKATKSEIADGILDTVASLISPISSST